jgi:hypothetical protein
MVNYIVFEGIEMYIFLFLIISLTICGLIGFIVGISNDDKADKYKNQFYIERQKNIELHRENMRLKLKCGELKAGEKVDV